MNKIELSKEAVKALKASIKHWEKDIIKNFEKGDKIIVDSNWDVVWKTAKRKVEYYGNHCPLCKLYDDDGDCLECPYRIFYGYSCDSGCGHWSKFDMKKCLRTAMAMRNALERILEKWG